MTQQHRSDNPHQTAEDVIAQKYREKRGECGESPPTLGSIHEEAWKEAQAHKWNLSEQRGHDVGEAALRDWYQMYWPDFCRFRRLEHVEGLRAWKEFDPAMFGELFELMQSNDSLLNEILDQVVFKRKENLDVLVWAMGNDKPVKRVVAILTQLDVNSARLEPLSA